MFQLDSVLPQLATEKGSAPISASQVSPILEPVEQEVASFTEEVSATFPAPERMDNLTTLCNNLDVEAGRCITPLQIFPRLKKMRLIELPSLYMWAENSMGEPSCDNQVTFPMLEELEIEDCPKLASIPVIPVVSKLRILGVHGTAVASVLMCIRLGSWPFLTTLTLGSLEDIPMLPLDAQQSQSQRPLEKLESLILKRPNSLIRSSGSSGSQLIVWKCFRFVIDLKIDGCSNLVRWPTEELRCMDRLSDLCITDCDYLEGNTSSYEEDTLPLSLEYLTIDNCRSVVALPWNLGNLAKLRRLWVEDCMSLKALPDGMCGLTSLRELWIHGCSGDNVMNRWYLQLQMGISKILHNKMVDPPSSCRYARRPSRHRADPSRAAGAWRPEADERKEPSLCLCLCDEMAWHKD
ncbi:hypothetical protein D1007_09799 [Hordeum vulgare]|nr:hypothetical protein D1007_09799 [Hordeum vulgare]